MNQDASIVEMLKSVLHFFKHESCGHCAPCRLGTAQLGEIVNRLAAHEGKKEDLDKLLKISEVMRDTSFCPLGQSLYLPISSALKYFKDEMLSHVKQAAS
jgi:NADH:ubiquinone oxidoreductase subunit F (NADH-binding)